MLAKINQLPINRTSVDEIVSYVETDLNRFQELINCFLKGNVRVSQLTSWAVGNIAEKHPEMIKPYHNDLLGKLMDKAVHNAVRRNIVRIYQTAPIPEEIEGVLYDYCLKAVNNPQEAVAIRVFSMAICERIALTYPDLIPELVESIVTQLPQGSAGFKNRGSKILHRLRKAIF